MADEVLINKLGVVERCIQRIQEEYCGHELADNYTKQDSIILNIQRLCEAAIDIANRVVRNHQLGLSKSARSFSILAQADYISKEMYDALQGMVGFRNVAVHEYQELDLRIIPSVIDNELDVVKQFAVTMLNKENT